MSKSNKNGASKRSDAPIDLQAARALVNIFEAEALLVSAPREPLATYERGIAGCSILARQQLEDNSHFDRIEAARRDLVAEGGDSMDEPRPVTQACFDCWKLFDAADERGTLGARIEQLAADSRAPKWRNVLANLNASRFGFYVVEQAIDEGLLELRDLFTGATRSYVMMPGWFTPDTGQTIFVRLAPPLTESHQVGAAVTEAIQVRVSHDELRSYFSRTFRRLEMEESPESYETVMKHGVGEDSMYWLRYIDRCMFHSQHDDAAYFKETPDRGMFAALQEVLEELAEPLSMLEMIEARSRYAGEVLAGAQAHADRLLRTRDDLVDALEEQWSDRPEVADPLVRALSAAVSGAERLLAVLDTA